MQSGPNAYIRNRKLSLAGREIVETDAKITDIALKYGYETPESFTKAFTRFHGIAPKFAREDSAKLLLFNPLVIKITVEGGKSMDYRMLQTEEKKFIYEACRLMRWASFFFIRRNNLSE